MADTHQGMRLDRREALLLSATAGMGLAFTTPAGASGSTKISRHE